MVDTGYSDYEYFYTVGGGLENFVANELMEHSSVQLITPGKVFFSSRLSPKSLLSIKTAERLFILVRRENQFLINRTKRDAISRFRAIVEGDSAQKWNKCLVKWKEFYRFFNIGECTDILQFRVSCKCSGKVKNIFPSYFLGRILAGSLLNTQTKWIPELRNPKLEILVHADVDMLTIGLACCLFNQPLSKRSYLSGIKGHSILRPTVCAAMLTLALKSYQNSLKDPVVLLDPMCGTGMILAEAAASTEKPVSLLLLGSDSDSTQISEAFMTVQRAEEMQKTNQNCNSKEEGLKTCGTQLFVADARALPLQNNSVHCIVSDLPFGLKHTCIPWPKHLTRVLTRIESTHCDTHAVTSANSTIEVNDRAKVTNSNDETEAGMSFNVQTSLGQWKNVEYSRGVDISTHTNDRRDHLSKDNHPKRGLKRKYTHGKKTSATETPEIVNKSDTIEDAKNMLPQIILEMDRVLMDGGQAILIISEALKSCLLDAVNFVTSSSSSAMCHSVKLQTTNTDHSGVSTRGDMTITPDLEQCRALDNSQSRGSEVLKSEDYKHLRSKKQGWSCTEEHNVRLGILDAVICVFNT